MRMRRECWGEEREWTREERYILLVYLVFDSCFRLCVCLGSHTHPHPPSMQNRCSLSNSLPTTFGILAVLVAQNHAYMMGFVLRDWQQDAKVVMKGSSLSEDELNTAHILIMHMFCLLLCVNVYDMCRERIICCKIMSQTMSE